MTITTKIEIDASKLEKELRAAWEAYNRRPDTWGGNEALGRVLHWVGDPTATQYVQKAIDLRLSILREDRIGGWEYIAIGVYYRLAEDMKNARQYFQKAYDKGKIDIGDINKKIKVDPMQDLCIACFLLEKYEETVFYGELLHQEEPHPRFIPWQLALRAEAVLTNDLAQMQAFVQDDAKRIRDIAGRGKFCETAFITLLDTYNISLDILNKMEIENGL